MTYHAKQHQAVNKEEKQLKINWVSGLSSLTVHQNLSKH